MVNIMDMWWFDNDISCLFYFFGERFFNVKEKMTSECMKMLWKFASLAQFYCDFSNLIGTLFQFL
jgi:hypothetical protein